MNKDYSVVLEAWISYIAVFGRAILREEQNDGSIISSKALQLALARVEDCGGFSYNSKLV